MNSWLAYKSNRTYVFQDYLWNPESYPWRSRPSKPTLPRTPLNALISGPTAGATWEPGDNSPRAISLRFFEKVCPQHERKLISAGDMTPTINQGSGDEIFRSWQKILLDEPGRCIEIRRSPQGEEDQSPQIWFWRSKRVLDVWDDFKNSPISRLLRTSPIVQSAVNRNAFLFQARGRAGLIRKGASRNPLDRMMVAQIQNGEYKDVCHDLAEHNSSFYGWNQLPTLPDKFSHPVGNENSEEILEGYIQHCYPEEDRIIRKIQQSRQDYINAARYGEVRYLDTLFLVINNHSDLEFLPQLKRKLHNLGWHSVVTSMELKFYEQQKDVAVAVDMDIARRAAVFIGNGVSFYIFLYLNV